MAERKAFNLVAWGSIPPRATTMKITFVDIDNNINVELDIPNKELHSMDGVNKAALQIARSFVEAIEKQGILVPHNKDENDSSES